MATVSSSGDLALGNDKLSGNNINRAAANEGSGVQDNETGVRNEDTANNRNDITSGNNINRAAANEGFRVQDNETGGRNEDTANNRNDVPSGNNINTAAADEGTGNQDNGAGGRNEDTANIQRSNTNTAEDDDGKATGDALEAALAQLGHLRFYQGYVLVLLCISTLLAPMYSLSYVFVADQVPFRCVVPECEGTSHLDFSNSTIEDLFPEDQCRRYIPLYNHSSCQREDFHGNQTQECDEFVYENHETIFAEFGLACREWLRTLVGTIHNAALPFALILTGYMSDSYGRRTTFCILSFFAGFLGIIKAFSFSYRMFVSMEFLQAALGYGFNSASYVMMVELARPSLRATFACASGVAYGLGGVLLALAAWRVPDWRYLLVTIHTPALLLPLYWLLLDESPRWLHAVGKTDRTIAVIRKAARWNKVKLDEEVMKTLESDCRQQESQPRGNPWLSLLRSRVLLVRFALCGWFWIASAFVYYGLTINSVSLSGDKYVNFALNMAMEVVASLLIMMSLERFGRKRSIFAAFLLCGVACVTPFFVSHTGTGLGLYFLGKLAITFAFNSVYVYTAELFPTATRSSALAACSLAGRLGSILAPQTPLLSMYVQALLYTLCSVTAALAVFLVPETRRARLPLGVRDAEIIRKEFADIVPAPPPARVPTVISADD